MMARLGIDLFEDEIFMICVSCVRPSDATLEGLHYADDIFSREATFHAFTSDEYNILSDAPLQPLATPLKQAYPADILFQPIGAERAIE